LHLRQIAKEWNQFFRANPKGTREQLLQKATEIDLKHGRLFQAASGWRQIAMTYFILEPEVAGSFGSATTGDLRAKSLRIDKFNYEFDTWLGDALLEAVSTFIVTDRLKECLVDAHASGVAFGYVEVTKSEIFLDLYGDRPLPAFSWLQITGQAGKDDFGLSSSRRLVVSERMMNLLKAFELKYCDISEYDPNKN
jgi:hypothetical protein